MSFKIYQINSTGNPLKQGKPDLSKMNGSILLIDDDVKAPITTSKAIVTFVTDIDKDNDGGTVIQAKVKAAGEKIAKDLHGATEYYEA